MQVDMITKSILIVDDDKLVLDSFSLILKSAVFSRVRLCNDPRLVASLLNDELKHPEHFSEIITNNRKMLSILRYIESVAGSSQSELIVGETGTGKKLIAHSVHRASRRQGNFIAVNAAGLDDSIFADTLFGHKKGAFTSADAVRTGLPKEAEHGTLFLDEIGDLTLNLQVKLLRLLQTNEYFPMGSDTPIVSSARIIAATNGNLEDATKTGEFRLDLYYRLHTYRIQLPPLRERPDDLQLLLECFLNKSAEQTGKKKPSYPKQLLALLACYDFPGNIRELESIVHDAVSTNESRIMPLEYFRRRILRFSDDTQALPVNQSSEALSLAGDYLPAIEEAEYFLVREAMRKTGDNQVLAAQLLGITRQTLKTKLNSAKGC
jgi:transcriptional regulator with PAS, ATPase and Fis domain